MQVPNTQFQPFYPHNQPTSRATALREHKQVTTPDRSSTTTALKAQSSAPVSNAAVCMAVGMVALNILVYAGMFFVNNGKQK